MQAAKAGDCKSPCLDLGARVVTEQFVGSNPTPLTMIWFGEKMGSADHLKNIG